jgi:hypothetical protein
MGLQLSFILIILVYSLLNEIVVNHLLIAIFGDSDADDHEEVEHDVNESEGNYRRNHFWNKTSCVSLDISEIESFSIQCIRQHYKTLHHT